MALVEHELEALERLVDSACAGSRAAIVADGPAGRPPRVIAQRSPCGPYLTVNDCVSSALELLPA